MFVLPTSNHLQRSLLMSNDQQARAVIAKPYNHRERVKQELQALGVSKTGMLKMESRYLPQVVHEDEHIGGVVYGQHKGSSVMIVATDKRVIFLDRKPLFSRKDEFKYDVVSGVEYSRVGFDSTVILHTRIKDINIRTMNQRCASNFVQYIESRSLEFHQ